MANPGIVVKSKIGKQISATSAERDILEALTVAVIVVVVSTSLSSLIFSIVLKGAIRRLLKAVTGLQVILNLMLLPVFLVSHAESFIRALQDLVFSNLYDRDLIAKMGDNDDTVA